MNLVKKSNKIVLTEYYNDSDSTDTLIIHVSEHDNFIVLEDNDDEIYISKEMALRLAYILGHNAGRLQRNDNCANITEKEMEYEND